MDGGSLLPRLHRLHQRLAGGELRAGVLQEPARPPSAAPGVSGCVGVRGGALQRWVLQQHAREGVSALAARRAGRPPVPHPLRPASPPPPHAQLNIAYFLPSIPLLVVSAFLDRPLERWLGETMSGRERRGGAAGGRVGGRAAGGRAHESGGGAGGARSECMHTCTPARVPHHRTHACTLTAHTQPPPSLRRRGAHHPVSPGGGAGGVCCRLHSLPLPAPQDLVRPGWRRRGGCGGGEAPSPPLPPHPHTRPTFTSQVAAGLCGGSGPLLRHSILCKLPAGREVREQKCAAGGGARAWSSRVVWACVGCVCVGCTGACATRSITSTPPTHDVRR